VGSQETKERILDVAERLFAAKGFHHTSLRALTGEAGVNLAAVNYHFGSKEALLKSLFARRLDPLNRERRQRIEQVREEARREGRAPGTGETIAAFIEPAINFRESGEGGRSFTALVGRALSDPDGSMRDLFMASMKPVFTLCYETLCEALPALPRQVVFWRFLFSLGAMTRLMCLAENDPLTPEGIELPADSRSLLELLLPFVTAGMGVNPP